MNFPDISKVQTTSGWTLLHCEQRHLPLTSLRIVIGGGTLSDSQKALGTAKMADQLLERHLRQRLRDFRFPSELDLSCDISHSVISLDCLSEDMPRCIEFLGRERHTFQLEKETILRQRFLTQQSINAGSDHPDILSHWMGRELFFGETHPLRFGTGGSLNTVEEIDENTLRESIRKRYQFPDGCVILAGDLSLDDAIGWVDKHLGGANPYRPKTPPAPTPNHGTFALQYDGSEQVEMTLFAHAPSRESALSKAARLGVIGLGGCFLSRLNQKLRIESGLTYGVNASYSCSPSDGMLVISASVDKNRVKEAIDLTQQTLVNCGKNWSKEELQMVKENHKSSVYSAWETIANLADCIESTTVNGLNPSGINERLKEVQDCSIEQIESAMTEISLSEHCLALCGDRWSIRSHAAAADLDFQIYRPQKLS